MTDGGDSPAAGPEQAESRQVTIVNQRGLHARAAARFVELADGFDAEIKVQSHGQAVSGLSIMGLMMLAAGTGTSLVISATGREAVVAVASLAALVEAGFDEQ